MYFRKLIEEEVLNALVRLVSFFRCNGTFFLKAGKWLPIFVCDVPVPVLDVL